MSDEKKRLSPDEARQFLGPKQKLFEVIFESLLDAFDATTEAENKDYYCTILCAMVLARSAMRRGEEMPAALEQLLHLNYTAYTPPRKILEAAMREVGMDPEKGIQETTPEQLEALAERLRKWKRKKES